MNITEVWRSNFALEMSRFHRLLFHFPIISVDTEFPGCLINTPQQVSDDVQYEILKNNIDNLEIIQLGITVSDQDGKVGGTWEFNFCDFDPVNDNYAPDSLDFLISHGIKFDEMKEHGVSSMIFGLHFQKILRVHNNGKLKWMTFHGLYDIAFVFKILSGGKPLPINLKDFGKFVGLAMGTVFDLKFMAMLCDDLNHGKLGLEKLANILDVARIGNSHQAGSDSLLTSCIFVEMMKKYTFLQQKEETYKGHLYGIKSVHFVHQSYPRLPMPPPIYVPQPYGPAFVRAVPCFPNISHQIPYFPVSN